MSMNEDGPSVGSAEAVEDEQAGGRVVGASVRRHPIAHASLFAPAGRRTMWWLTIRCPHCGRGHFSRLRSPENAQGVRRTGCGRRVRIVVARTYPAQDGGR